jgi:hypothetical protein
LAICWRLKLYFDENARIERGDVRFFAEHGIPVLLIASLSTHGLLAQPQAKITYLNPGDVSAPAQPFFKALGGRVWSPGKERVTLSRHIHFLIRQTKIRSVTSR